MKKKKIKTPKRILERQKAELEKVRQYNLEWYKTHPGWWGTKTGEMLKEHWKLTDEETKGCK